MVVGALVIQDQMSFIQKQDLGFDKEQLVIVPLRNQEDFTVTDPEIIKNRVKEIPEILTASFAAGVPGKSMLIDRWPVVQEGAEIQSESQMTVVGVDHDYLETMGIELIDGRNFSREFSTDASDAFIASESAIKALGIEGDPMDARIYLREGGGKTGQIVGVVKDLHLRSLHEPTGPMVYHIWPDRYSCMVVKVGEENMETALNHIQDIWSEFSPETPFEYSFVDEEYDRYYEADRRLGQIFTGFSILAIIISCLGLFGLATLMTEQRSKEIGIRKVLGASVKDIVQLFLSRFSKWVFIGFIISIPIAWILAQDWLNSFAVRVGVRFEVFLIAGLMIFGIAWLTVGYHALKMARSNPVEALRDL